VIRDAIVGRTKCEQVVNPNRTESLKQVLSRTNGAFFLDTEQILGNQIDEIGLDHAFEDGIPVTVDTLYVMLDVEGLGRHDTESVGSNGHEKSMFFLREICDGASLYLSETPSGGST
jgi:hypothetical protein